MLNPNPRRADAGHPTIPMHRPEAPRFAPTTPPPDEALMLGLAAEFRQPLAHGVFSPPPRNHPRLHRSVGGLVMRPTVWQGAHRGVTRRWNTGGIFGAGARSRIGEEAPDLLGWFRKG
jgi:hypothetical protein